MKNIKELKKGDIVTVIRNNGIAKSVYVVSNGKKYIGVSDEMDKEGYMVTKFDVNTLQYTDGKPSWLYPYLFLGTIEEYREKENIEKECDDLVRFIKDKISRHLGKEKLNQIKQIIEL